MEDSLQKTAGKIALLAGGGIDSSVCMQVLKNQGYKVRAIHVDYGQQASSFEWDAVQKVSRYFACDAVQVCVAGLPVRKGPEVVGRNAAFTFLALMAQEADELGICLGIHRGTPFYDCSTVCYKQLDRLVQEYTDSRILLLAPLLEFSKKEIVDYAKSCAFPLALTYSCQEGVAGGCGHCHSCLDRENLQC